MIGTAYLVVDDDERYPIAAFSTHAAAWAYIDGMPAWQHPEDYDVDEHSLDRPPPYMEQPKPQPVDPTAPVINAALTRMAVHYFQPTEAGLSNWMMPPPKEPK